MATPLTSLAALRAFEAVARHLSLTRAADELHLTHGAVSHQIKNLEEYLGVRLIAREGRGIVLTAAGQVFGVKLRAALEQLTQVIETAKAGHAPASLKISVLPSFAAKWLLPRLPRFMTLHPEVEVSLNATLELSDFRRDDFDLALRYGRGTWFGVSAEKLLDEEIFAVCSPGFVNARLPRSAAEIADKPLLRDASANWRAWFRAAGLDDVEPKALHTYNDSGLMLQAAVDGQGIALARSVLAHDDLLAGRLVRLPGPALPAEFSYYVAHAADAPLSAGAALFLDWLRTEAGTAN